MASVLQVISSIERIGNAAVEQAIDDLIYDLFEPSHFFPNNASEPGKMLNKCQVAIGKNAAKFLTAKEKILNKCWDAKLSGKAGFADRGVVGRDYPERGGLRQGEAEAGAGGAVDPAGTAAGTTAGSA